MTAVCRLLELDSEVVGSVTDRPLLLEAAERLQPDVIVLDVNLPKLSGLDACRQITQAHPEIKIIVFTAMLDPAVRDKSFAAGASAFVSKLAGAGELLSTIKTLSVGSLNAFAPLRRRSVRHPDSCPLPISDDPLDSQLLTQSWSCYCLPSARRGRVRAGSTEESALGDRSLGTRSRVPAVAPAVPPP